MVKETPLNSKDQVEWLLKISPLYLTDLAAEPNHVEGSQAANPPSRNNLVPT
jgi:hypothetical protein